MIEIHNGIIREVRELGHKRERDQRNLFVAEGMKCVRDTWGSFRCRYLIATRAWQERYATAEHHNALVIARRQDMERMTQFTTAPEVMAVYEKPVWQPDHDLVERGLTLMLDDVQDPGNLGTIMRLADWFGIRQIFAAEATVDVFNHKVVQATMGAISRVRVFYGPLADVLDRHPDLPVYGTFLDGENIYTASLGSRGFIVLGNEGKGIGEQVARRATSRLLIPAAAGCGSESLNVGMAAAITLSEFFRTRFM